MWIKLKAFAERHPRITAWVALAIGMVVILVIAARDVGLLWNQWLFLILATIGLEALGLGPQNQPTLGMIIYWALYYTAVLRGLWWWWAPPIIVIVLTFMGLFLVSAGLDQIANPRLRRPA